MKPRFALSLSFEGIALLHRAAGGWRSVGEVALDVPDLAGALAGLREMAARLEPEAPHCKLIIPNDQIRYLTLETGSFEGEARRAMVESALDGATPYRIEELAYDISVEGTRTHVAAVARETLAEAETFALEHGFSPVSFVAIPGDEPFLGEPFFGASRFAETLPGGGEAVEADGVAVVVIGPATLPPEPPQVPEPPQDDPAAATSQEEPAAAEAQAPPPDAPAPAAIPRFSSRRSSHGGGKGAAPSLAGARRGVSRLTR